MTVGRQNGMQFETEMTPSGHKFLSRVCLVPAAKYVRSPCNEQRTITDGEGMFCHIMSNYMQEVEIITLSVITAFDT